LDGQPDFLELVKQRSSCRDYLEKPVPDEILNTCLEAARWAPSACNKQPWRFIAVKDSALRKQICDKALLPGIPMPWLKKAPLIMVLCAVKSLVTHSLAPMLSGVKYHLVDIGIAGEHFVIAAENQGIGTCWIGWFKPKAVRKILNIPRDVEILSLISAGYPASSSEPASRLSLEEISCVDQWKI
jgi:nitroreductase